MENTHLLILRCERVARASKDPLPEIQAFFHTLAGGAPVNTVAEASMTAPAWLRRELAAAGALARDAA